MFWRIDQPLTLRPRLRTLPETLARELGLPSSWTTVDAMADDRLVVPDLGEADCQNHDTLAVDFDPRRRELLGFWALRRVGSFVVAIPHFDGPRIERFFPPPRHALDFAPALGPEAYESLRVHLALPAAETVTALSTTECLACFARFLPSCPFHFDGEDIARLDADRVLVPEKDRGAVLTGLGAFLETASRTARALEFTAIELVPAVELRVEPSDDVSPYTAFGSAGSRWGFRFPSLRLAAFPPDERSR